MLENKNNFIGLEILNFLYQGFDTCKGLGSYYSVQEVYDNLVVESIQGYSIDYFLKHISELILDYFVNIIVLSEDAEDVVEMLDLQGVNDSDILGVRDERIQGLIDLIRASNVRVQISTKGVAYLLDL